jgi:hypothetical protein
MKTRRSTGFSSSKSWHVDEVCVCPTPGGEPLYHVPYEFALFASTFDAAKKRVNKRLPRMTHRFAALSVRRKRTPKTQGKWSRRDVPGSRLISHVLAGLALRRMLRGWRDTRQSGLPDEASWSLNDGAKSGSPPDVGQSRASTVLKNE